RALTVALLLALLVGGGLFLTVSRRLFEKERIERQDGEPENDALHLPVAELLRQAGEALDRKEPGRALDLANQALDQAPENAPALVLRARAYHARDELDQALADLDQAVRLNPEGPDAYPLRGDIREQRGDVEGALADFTQAVRLDPGNAQAWYRRGLLHTQ